MIWFTLALFAISFLAVALLSPKPNIENARKEQLDPESFPRATEDAPIPLVLGTVRLRAPNTLWYGRFRTRKITEKIKTGLFSSKKVTVGYKYYLSIVLGLCLGPAVLRKTFIDGVEVSGGITIGEPIDEEVIDVTGFNKTTQDTVEIPTVYNLNSAGITDAQVNAGAVRVRAKTGGYYRNILGNPGPLTVQLFVTFKDGGGGTIVPPDGTGTYTTTSGPATLEETQESDILVPAGTETIEIYAKFIYFGVGGSITVTSDEGEITAVSIPTFGAADINEPELFGGEREGGGVVGDYRFYTGTFAQLVDTYIEGLIGSGLWPAYRGTAYVVYEDLYIGESPQLRAFEFELQSFAFQLGTPFLGAIGSGSLDINPAEALYEVMTNRWRGLGIDEDDIDRESFVTAATTLQDEGNGCSLIVTAPNDAKTTIVEILRQVDGVLRENAEGKIEMFLIRQDYDAGTLPIYDEDDIIEITSYTKTSWEDVVSEVKASFSSREKESTRIALAQNMAITNMLGRRKTAEISFPFCYDADLATQLAARELAVLSIPLYRMKIVMNRNGYSLRVGSVFKVSWTEFGIVEIIMRVQKVDLGQIDDNKIILEIAQDRFAIGTAVFASPEDSGWVDDRPTPQDVTWTIVEMPYFYSSGLEYPIPDGFGSVIVYPIMPQAESDSYSTYTGITTTDITYSDIQNVDYPFTGLITAAISREDGFATGVMTSFTVDGFIGETPVDVTTAEVRTGEFGIIYMNGEWMAYESFTDNLDNTYTFGTVYRGLFGTRPLDHADNTRMFIFSVSQLEEGGFGEVLADNATAYVKVTDTAGGATRDPSAVTHTSYAMQAIADRPLRPRDLQLDASRTLPFEVTGMHDLTWVASNRGETQVVFEQDAADTPDQAETYDVEVWIDGVEEVSLADTGITSPHTIDFTGISGVSGEIRLYSRRTVGGLETSYYYAFFPITFPVGTIDSTALTIDSTTTTVDSA